MLLANMGYDLMFRHLVDQIGARLAPSARRSLEHSRRSIRDELWLPGAAGSRAATKTIARVRYHATCLRGNRWRSTTVKIRGGPEPIMSEAPPALAMHQSPRCGALTRRRTRCQSPAMPNGRAGCTAARAPDRVHRRGRNGAGWLLEARSALTRLHRRAPRGEPDHAAIAAGVDEALMSTAPGRLPSRLACGQKQRAPGLVVRGSLALQQQYDLAIILSGYLQSLNWWTRRVPARIVGTIRLRGAVTCASSSRCNRRATRCSWWSPRRLRGDRKAVLLHPLARSLHLLAMCGIGSSASAMAGSSKSLASRFKRRRMLMPTSGLSG